MKSMTLAVVMVLAASMSTAVLAHHGGNLYDTTKAVVLKDATVTKFEWGTPHNQIYFDAKSDKGELQHWVASTEPAPVMLERGWTRRSLKEGDVVTVYIFAAKKRRDRGEPSEDRAEGREKSSSRRGRPRPHRRPDTRISMRLVASTLDHPDAGRARNDGAGASRAGSQLKGRGGASAATASGTRSPGIQWASW
jgi:hypothetical protein